MVASQVHLVRHGEVFNPDGILYGRLQGFGLSKLGIRMAQSAADDLVSRERPIAALIASPLQRTRESALPIAAAFGLPVQIDERIIEPTNHFEGTVMSRALRRPQNWPYLVNPWRPSWGEPYVSIAERMRAAIDAAFDSVDEGDVVLVSHQLPIWITHLSIAGERLAHNPSKRRCNLSSITTFTRQPAPVGESQGPESATSGPGAVASSEGGAAASPAGSEPPAGSESPAGSEPPAGSESPAGSEPPAGPESPAGSGSPAALRVVEVGYVEPARALQQSATDVGAV